MAHWYCYIGGQQYGPVAEEVLRAWIGEGRVTASDYVWTEGMSDWVAAGTVPGLFVAGQASPPDHYSLVLVPRPEGSGGQTPNGQITAQARARLSGYWWLSVGFCFVLGLLGSGGGIPYIGPIIALVLTGPLQIGEAVFFLTLVRRDRPEFEMMFRGFRNFGNALGAYLLAALFIFLWSLLLIIPGIIAGLAYSQVFYLMAQDQRLGPLEAIRTSKRMMAGHKWKLFCLGLRFFGWAMLCILTLGIGFLWLTPYMNTAYARFHDDLYPLRDGQPSALPADTSDRPLVP